MLRSIDYHFCLFIYKLSNGDDLVTLAAALASNSLATGHSCWQWSAEVKQLLFENNDITNNIINNISIKKSQWLDYLKQNELIGDGNTNTPIVIVKNKIYLYRYWNYEQQISNWLLTNNYLPLDNSNFTKWVTELFPANNSTAVNWQKIAAIQACISKFTLITGGPGTGKTTTVAKILVLLYRLDNNKNLTISLAAPTGKAAARMNESINSIKQQILSDNKNINLKPATTIHKLLEISSKESYPKRNADNKLVTDILIIDEASMIDLELMAQLLVALPKNVRLILLGDQHQLPSVAPGNLIVDICTNAIGFSKEHHDTLTKLSEEQIPLDVVAKSTIANSVIQLQTSYRFKQDSSIGVLSSAIKNSNKKQLLNCLQNNKKDLSWFPTNSDDQIKETIKLALKLYTNYFNAIKHMTDPHTIFALFNQFRLLCALRETNYGIKQINNQIEFELHNQKIIPKSIAKPVGKYYFGRPIILNRNNYAFGLANGDTGIILAVNNKLQAAFINDNSETIYVPIAQLADHDAAYAITVHKSQGSEFDQVALLLPIKNNSLLTNELLYTAITRAKQRLAIFASENILLKSLNNHSNRLSGLADLLHQS